MACLKKAIPRVPEEINAYLADLRQDKRTRLIDRLLERPEYANYFALKWADTPATCACCGAMSVSVKAEISRRCWEWMPCIACSGCRARCSRR